MNKGIIFLIIFILFLGCKNTKKVNDKFEISEKSIENEDKIKYRYAKDTIFNDAFYYEPLKSYTIKNMEQVEFLNNVFTQDELSEYIEELEIKTSITDIEFLSKFPYLRELKIEFGDKIDNIEIFRYLNNLEILEIDGIKKYIEFLPISNLINLKQLIIINSEIDDLSPITYLENLESLYLYNNKIKNINPMYEIKSLKILEYWEDNIDTTNIYKLENLECLRILYITQEILNDIVNLKELKELYTNYFKINDISPLVKLACLENLHINYNRSIDYKILVKIKTLKEIEFAVWDSYDDWRDFVDNKERFFEENGISIPLDAKIWE